MRIVKFAPGETVIPSNTPMSDGIWICLKGSLFQNGSTIAQTFSIIGDGFRQQPAGTSFDAEVTANGDTTAGFISTNSIAQVCKGESWD